MADRRTIDSPLENLAIYEALMKDGTIPGITATLPAELSYLTDSAFTSADLAAAGTFLAAATDKSSPMTLDEIAYLNRILDIGVTTVEGSEEVEVPAGTQSGTEIRLRGKGVPRLRGAGRGDLHVVVNVVVPAKLSKRERELLRELGEVSEPAVLPKGGTSVFERLRDLFG